MTTPSPFDIGRAVGGKVSGGFRGANDKSAIDEILEQANASGNQQDIDRAMQSILTRVSPEKQQMASQVLQQKQQRLNQAKQKQALQAQGLDPTISDLDPGVQKEIVKGHQTAKKSQDEGQSKVQNAFQRAQEILDSGYTGFSPTGLTPEGREQRAELDTLSEVFISHLIPLLNPKGTISKDRFNYIKSLVPSSFDTDATIKGKLKALKDIFKIEGEGQQAQQMQDSNSRKSQTREMRDSQGNVYDIPEDLYEKARAQGLT